MSEEKSKGYEKLTPERKALVDTILQNLENGDGLWKQGWVNTGVPESAITGKQYHGKSAIVCAENGIIINREQCVACGKCSDECPTGALECKGKEVGVDEVFAELIKDEAYFGSEGGVTLSGGEITMQASEAAELLSKIKERGIGTALDTCGLTTKSNIDLLFPYVDVFLYDVKLIDSEEHKKFTGVGNEIILENFSYLAEKIKGTDKKIWVRTPIIPGATDTDNNNESQIVILNYAPIKRKRLDLRCRFFLNKGLTKENGEYD